MVARTHGYRFKSRKLLSKSPREKGRPGLFKWLLARYYRVGDKLVIDIDPVYISTAPHKRYQGRVGTLIGWRGKALVLEVNFMGERRIIITTPEHVKPLNLEDFLKERASVKSIVQSETN
ncbi:50S ribosomal protein L21e [Caldivirga sp.]|uniref:50S ribosomal protein L21e n=1 Tax=Caldivirga sp. TaxID=2080243 RepID=UPI0025C23791|nr:50S ribosomal protein L21e [Caldivirga sp.]